MGPQLPFAPFLVEGKGGFRSFVLDSLFVENGKHVYLQEENNSTLFDLSSSLPFFRSLHFHKVTVPWV